MTIQAVQARIGRELQKKMDKSAVHNLIKRLGLSCITPGPVHHKQDQHQQEVFKKIYKRKRETTAIRSFSFLMNRGLVHTQKLWHTWFTRVQRTQVQVKLGFKNFYLYSAIDPKTGEDFTLIFRNVNTQCLNVFLGQLSQKLGQKQIILVMDGAGCHKAKGLVVRDNIEIGILPPYSPELNPVERFWQYIKRRTIKNEIFTTLAALEKALTRFFYVRLMLLSSRPFVARQLSAILIYGTGIIR